MSTVNAGAPGRNVDAARMRAISPTPGRACEIAAVRESRSFVGSPGLKFAARCGRESRR
jgi:hypothetical protein